MRATFVHTADNHLGYEQYGYKARFDDFAKAFYSVIDADGGHTLVLDYDLNADEETVPVEEPARG